MPRKTKDENISLAKEERTSIKQPASKKTILVIDDEPSHREMLREALDDRYHVLDGGGGEEGVNLALSQAPDLVLLDMHMPERNGISVCAQLRQNEATRHIPVIMVTGFDSQNSRTACFQMGADDYISKPYSVDELRARVESKIRRVSERGTQVGKFSQCGNLVLNRAKMEAKVNGGVIPLSALEFNLLAYFVDNKEQILTRERILDAIWHNAVVTPRTVDTHISFLRKKLEPCDYMISTLYGAGYILKSKVEGAQ